MPTFDFRFTVDAPVEAVAAFHHDTSVLKALTPPPAIVRIHEMEPLGEGSVSKFTIWAGPIPIHWTAVHSNVTENGFTDTQAEGLMARWEHTHRYDPIDDTSTEVVEHIEYEYGTGWQGVLGRLLFNPPALAGLFQFRKWKTRRSVAR